jgi:[ribosomal protein S5]-alanine N-acetyltransferase
VDPDKIFTQFPVLNTGRLILRQVQLEDSEAVYAIKSDYQVTSQYGMEPHASITATQGWIQRSLEAHTRRENFVWLITLKGNGSVAGLITLWNIDPGFHCAELGFELAPKNQRCGIMLEAAAPVLEFGFTGLGLHRIEAVTFAENTASIALLCKLKFNLEGTLRERVYFHGSFYDESYFALLNSEWLKTPLH